MLHRSWAASTHGLCVCWALHLAVYQLEHRSSRPYTAYGLHLFRHMRCYTEDSSPKLRPCFHYLTILIGNSVPKRKHVNSSAQHPSHLSQASLLLCCLTTFQPLILFRAFPKYCRSTRSPNPATQSKLPMHVLSLPLAWQVNTMFQSFVLRFSFAWQVGTILQPFVLSFSFVLAGWHHFPAIDHLRGAPNIPPDQQGHPLFPGDRGCLWCRQIQGGQPCTVHHRHIPVPLRSHVR